MRASLGLNEFTYQCVNHLKSQISIEIVDYMIVLLSIAWNNDHALKKKTLTTAGYLNTMHYDWWPSALCNLIFIDLTFSGCKWIDWCRNGIFPVIQRTKRSLRSCHSNILFILPMTKLKECW